MLPAPPHTGPRTCVAREQAGGLDIETFARARRAAWPSPYALPRRAAAVQAFNAWAPGSRTAGGRRARPSPLRWPCSMRKGAAGSSKPFSTSAAAGARGPRSFGGQSLRLLAPGAAAARSSRGGARARPLSRKPGATPRCVLRPQPARGTGTRAGAASAAVSGRQRSASAATCQSFGDACITVMASLRIRGGRGCSGGSSQGSAREPRLAAAWRRAITVGAAKATPWRQPGGLRLQDAGSDLLRRQAPLAQQRCNSRRPQPCVLCGPGFKPVAPHAAAAAAGAAVCRGWRTRRAAPGSAPGLADGSNGSSNCWAAGQHPAPRQ